MVDAQRSSRTPWGKSSGPHTECGDYFRFLSAAAFCVAVAFCFSATAAGQENRHSGPVTEFTSAGETSYACSQAGVFEVAKGEPILTWRPPFRPTSIAGYSDGKISFLLIGGGEPGVSGIAALFDLRTKEIRSLELAKDLVYGVAVNAAGDVGAAACADNRVVTFDLFSLAPESMRTRHEHTAAARVVRFSSDGKWLASAGLDGVVLLSLAGGEEPPASPAVLQEHSAKVDCLVFSPDSTQFASGARDGKVRIHTVEGRLVRTYSGLSREIESPEEEGINPYVWALAWGDKADALVAGTSQGDLYRLSTSDNRWRRIERPGSGPIYSLLFSANGELLIGTDKVSRWNLRGDKD